MLTLDEVDSLRSKIVEHVYSMFDLVPNHEFPEFHRDLERHLYNFNYQAPEILPKWGKKLGSICSTYLPDPKDDDPVRIIYYKILDLIWETQKLLGKNVSDQPPSQLLGMF